MNLGASRCREFLDIEYYNPFLAVVKESCYRTVGTFCYRFNKKIKKNKKLIRQYKVIKRRFSQEWT